MSKLSLGTPLSEAENINKRFLPKLKKLGLKNVRDLLWHFPRRYKDFSDVCKIKDLESEKRATIKGVVESSKVIRIRGRRLTIFEAKIEDDSGSIQAIWFNQPYLKNTIKEGVEISIAGTPKFKKRNLQFSNPIYEITKNNGEATHTGRIIPVYPETKGLTSKGLRFIIKPLLENVAIEETVPRSVLQKENMPDISEALKMIHFPEKMEDVESARKRFLFESIFFLRLHHEKNKSLLAKEKAFKINIDKKLHEKKLSTLPFSLTKDQSSSVGDIFHDISKSTPMNRLIQGDVGSGKTIVAFLSAVQVAKENHQVAIMAPTEILARQHYESFKKLFPEFNQGVALITNNESRVFYENSLESDVKKPELLSLILKGEIKIVFGTHALIQKKVGFKDLALAVIDEQHRFGIKQRKSLVGDRSNKKIPHFLSMSATPIPRTMALAVFGDLELSFINELPKNRKPIFTKVIPPSKRSDAYEFIRKNIKNGRQAFVICPRIEKSEGSEKNRKDEDVEKKSVVEEYKKLTKKVFPDLRVGMLHGKMDAKEKEKIMKSFADAQDKNLDILVATSMVEVGVDVPNATIMMIEGAELFGLSQLYQFKGRVGRGKHKSYCLLFTESSKKEAVERLKIIEKAKNGLELAEHDLKLRGPGELLGKSQTGLPDRAMEALQRPDIVQSAINSATKIFEEEGLKKYPDLKRRLKKFEKIIHEE